MMIAFSISGSALTIALCVIVAVVLIPIALAIVRRFERWANDTNENRQRADALEFLPAEWTARSRKKGFDILSAITFGLALAFLVAGAEWSPGYLVAAGWFAISVFFGRRSIAGSIDAAAAGMHRLERSADIDTINRYYDALSKVYNEHAMKRIRERAEGF